MGEKEKKIVKTIKVDLDKCNGCRACEVVCSAFHAAPEYSSNNPARSRIRV
ncbi:MAG: 4Fe-4S binding protein, partial [Desulfobacterales bacterium]|nr:4Fe-4S binding protein [Desulfobacterales bacterium]